MIKYFISAMLVIGPFAAGARTVTSNPELQMYKDAVSEKLIQLPNARCITASNYVFILNDLLSRSTQVEVNEAGTQPLLKFSFFSPSDNLKLELQVSTDPSYLNILGMRVRSYLPTRVNSGTLKDPIMQDGFAPYPIYNADCVLK